MKRLANILTLFRIAAAGPLLVLIGLEQHITAFIVFVIAALTDLVDGWLARRHGVSRFGTMMDPIADKVLVITVLLALVAGGDVSGFHIVAVWLIVLREVFVSGLREHLATRAVTIPVTRLAKWKTTAQLVACGALLLGPLWPEMHLYTHALLWLATALTVWTGVGYGVRALRR